MRIQFKSSVVPIVVVVVAAACAGKKPTEESTAAEQVSPGETSIDTTASSGEAARPRLWMSHYADHPDAPRMKGSTPIVVIEAVPSTSVSGLASKFGGCPSVMKACPTRQEHDVTWTIRLYASTYGAKHGLSEHTSCEISGATDWQGTHICDEPRRGVNLLSLDEKAGELLFDVQGDLGWGRISYHDLPFVSADPIDVAFRVMKESGNSSPETGHLSGMVEGADKAARSQTEFNADGVRAALEQLGIDPRSLPLSTAIEIRNAVLDKRLYAVRLSPSKRAALLKGLVATAVGEPTGEPFEPGENAVEKDGVTIEVTAPGEGEPLPEGAAVKLEYYAYTVDRLPLDVVAHTQRFRWEELTTGVQQALLGMRPGEQRQAWIPGDLMPDGWPTGTLVYKFTLVDWTEVPTAPSDLEAPPAGAKKTPSGIPYVILEEGSGERPTGSDRVAFYYFAWTPRGELFDFYSLWNPMKFALDHRMITSDPWLHEALGSLRPGARAIFYVPADAQQPGRDDEAPRDLRYEIRTVDVGESS